jgi:membrane protein
MNYLKVTKNAFSGWSADKASVWAASLAYFTVFSLSPLLLLLTSLAGIFLGEEAVKGQLFGQIEGLVGPDAAALIQQGVSKTTQPSGNIIATVIGIVTLILGATGIFGQLQQAFNSIWNVKASPQAGIKSMLIGKLLSFGMLLIIAFLLAISVGLSFITSVATNYLDSFASIPIPVMEGVNLIISFFVLTLLFGAMFKILPDIKIPFKAVLPGAALTALLFVIGKFLIGWYIGRSAYTSTYGAAGSLMILLVWVYYSVQLLLLGAEFSKAYAKEKGIKVVPSKNAVSTEVEKKVIKVKANEVTGKEKAAAVGGYVAAGMITRFIQNLTGKQTASKRR